MTVEVAPGAGFCFGVKRALRLAFEAARGGDGRVVTLGPIIHNPQVVERLEEEGLRVVNDLDEIETGTLVVRSHGLPASVLEEARRKGLTIVDATCPFVKQVQDRAKELEQEGYLVVVVGEEDHPEVLSITGSLEKQALVVDGPGGLAGIDGAERVGVVCQTTQPPERLRSVVEALLAVAPEVRVYNTICEATFERQANALELAKRADVMLVVGGRNSANTRRLWELCREAGSRAYHIETADEFQPSWLEDAGTVGITGGASTPQWIIDELVCAVESAMASGGTGGGTPPSVGSS
ncbi:MAG: 4-hydroxy-3-methylbut-2-enyl diphosphate reductase [Candidatus Eisenbacteria bacterium]|nr:4-hydroxy-3-methylbut-2-enyl diphosphate reductase [Candidatus Eisenbacteria bacterium]